jgi:hypothetical protein
MIDMRKAIVITVEDAKAILRACGVPADKAVSRADMDRLRLLGDNDTVFSAVIELRDMVKEMESE